MYADEVDPSTTAILAMTSDSWELVDVTLLRLNHQLSKTAIVNSKPTVTPSTVSKS